MIYTHRISRAKKRGALGLILGLFVGVIATLAVTRDPFTRYAQAEVRTVCPADSNTGLSSLTENAANWPLLLINEEHPLSTDYTPPALVQLDAEHSVDSRIASNLKEMMADGAAMGLDMYITSAYRSYDRQTELFNEGMQTRMNKGLTPLEAYQETKSSVALPGASEHQAGLAVDIIASAYPELDERQGDTPEQQWLMSHCQEYGFILRYPKGTEDITGITYEPWHYRYVGREAAKEIVEQGVTLEEYLGL